MPPDAQHTCVLVRRVHQWADVHSRPNRCSRILPPDTFSVLTLCANDIFSFLRAAAASTGWLKACDTFERRHIGPNVEEEATMLKTCGVAVSNMCATTVNLSIASHACAALARLAKPLAAKKCRTKFFSAGWHVLGPDCSQHTARHQNLHSCLVLEFGICFCFSSPLSSFKLCKNRRKKV